MSPSSAETSADGRSRSPGRPRDPRIDEAVRLAAIELLVEGGYNALGLEAVAKRAGVGHTSVYRRWPSKAHLVHELLFTDVPATVQPTDVSEVEELITGMVAGSVRLFSQPAALAAVPGLLAEFYADATLRRALTERLETRFRDEFRRLVQVGIEEGRLRSSVSADTLLDAIAGTVMFSLFVDERDTDGEFMRELVDILLHGVVDGEPRTR